MSDMILVTIAGPTAIGKTRIALALAQHFKTEIVSADSRQFYQEMSIGTAVPSAEELASVPHHLIQHKSIFQDYSVGDFEREALSTLERLFKQYKVVIVVGGSGLYLDALTDGLDDFPEINPAIRHALNKELAENGIASLQEALEQQDPVYYRKVDLNNPHRLIRALEVCLGTGLPYSSFLTQPKKTRPFRIIRLGIMAEREVVYGRINERVDQMMEKGLLAEVKALREHQHLNALQTVAYKELFRYLNDEYDLETAITEIKKNSRRFAKRQMTWFRKNKDIIWVSYDAGIDSIVDLLKKAINAKSKT